MRLRTEFRGKDRKAIACTHRAGPYHFFLADLKYSTELDALGAKVDKGEKFRMSAPCASGG